MVAIHCDNCEHEFDAADDAPGGKIACPRCGDVNRLPGAATNGNAPTPAKPQAEAAPVRTPSAAEETIMVVRQAMFRAHPFWYMVMIMVFLAGIALAIMAPTSSGLVGYPWLAWVGLGAAAAAALWWLFWWAAPHRWVKLTITNKRTIRQEGIVMRRTSEVLHNHIRNIKIEQSVINRLLGVGSISIDSAGGSEDEPIEIVMLHVRGPYQVKETIDRHRRL